MVQIRLLCRGLMTPAEAELGTIVEIDDAAAAHMLSLGEAEWPEGGNAWPKPEPEPEPKGKGKGKAEPEPLV